MKKGLLITFLCLFALVLTAVVTCPDKVAHETAVKEELNTYMGQAMKEKLNIGESNFEQGMAMFGASIASSMFGSVLESSLHVKNNFIYSVGEMNILGNKKTVSIGAFGHVFVGFTADDLMEQLNEQDNEQED